MKRILQLCLLLTCYQAAAQTDFHNDYMITLTGGVTYGGDLSSGCGSKFEITVVFQDGSSQMLISEGHGGGGTHNYIRKVVFKSNNKITQIIAYGEAYRQNPTYRSCGHRRIDRGNITINIDTTTNYPCADRRFVNVFRGYNSSTMNVSIQPVSDRVSTTVTLVNDATARRRMNYTVTANYSNGTSEPYLSAGEDPWPANAVENNAASTYAQRPITDVQSFSLTSSGQRRVSRFFFDYNTSNSFLLSASPEDNQYQFNLFANTAQSTLRITHEKAKFELHYGPDNSNILPSDTTNRIILLGPARNPSAFYHWVYSSDGNTWIDLPAKYQGRHRIAVSGYDIQGDDFWNYHNTNIFFKIIVDCNGAESEILILSRRVSAPNMLAVTPDPDRCFDRPLDGTVKINFNRPLMVASNGDRETLSILLVDNVDPTITLDQLTNVVFETDNSITWPRRLQSGRSYVIKLIGRFKGVATYTDNVVYHSHPFDLIRPVAVTSVITPQAVHCYGGGDGAIQLEAEGGVGNYKFAYLPAGATDSTYVNFSNATLHAIEFLRSGRYGFTVKDANNCKDAAGGKTIALSEPSAPLSIDFSQLTDPLAFGYTDGFIETILTGGTPLPDRSYTIEWYDPVNLLPILQYENAPLSQGYQANIRGLGDGFYQLKAYDSQYALAHVDHRAGCEVVSDLFHLVEPPPIVIDIAEWHFVSCHSYDDGALVAHVQGGVKFPSDLPYHYNWEKETAGMFQPITQSDSIGSQLVAGTYRVIVHDKNNIEKISSPFLLVEPDVLTITMTTTPISCSSGSDGTAATATEGGTLPYRYDWSDGNSSASNQNLIEGNYFVLVKDVRGCTATAKGSVISPFPLHVDSLITHPNCYGDGNGSIQISVTQGTSPYHFEWNTGETTESIQQLHAGTYTLKIVDRNDCISYRRYEIINPEPVVVSLGADRILCVDQTYTANATIRDPQATYQWSSAGGFNANTPSVVLKDEGTYLVRVVDSKGCVGEDVIAIKRILVDIASDFIVTTQAFRNEVVTMVNISNPLPDSVTWTSSTNKLKFVSTTINKSELIFKDTGTYYVTLKTYRQGCEKSFSKAVVVVDGTFSDVAKNESQLLEEFSVYPNPNQGKFSTRVKLREAVPIRIRMLGVSNNVMVDDKQAYGNQEYDLSYDMRLSSGTYFMLLETVKGNYILRVVIY